MRPGNAPPARLLGWTGRQLDPRDNALNLLRLVLAALVLVAHAWPLAGQGEGPIVDRNDLGGWALFGFFAISGYLIMGSRLTHSLGTYLVHRIARIMPAFLVCLVVMAAVFAPLDYVHTHHTLAGYFTTGPTTPLDSVFRNAALKITSYDIAGTPAKVPYPGAWNGSLWSLYYEFLCYLVVAAVGLLAFVRRSAWTIAALWALTVVVHATWASTGAELLGGNEDARLLAQLLPVFLGGALVQMLRHRLPLHAVGAAVSVAAVALAALGTHGWSAQLAAPFIAYGLLYAGSVIPMPRVLARHDISYGVYIYAFPVQQLLASAGLNTHGLVVFDVLALLGTVVLATASWLLVERPVMRRARTGGRAPVAAEQPRIAPVPTAGALSSAGFPQPEPVVAEPPR